MYDEELVEPAARHTSKPPRAASDAFGAIEDLGLLGEVEHIRIHRARDPELRRQVALVLPAVRSGAAAAVVREARLLARLRHPCVPVVLGHGALSDGTPCTAMEMPETQPLSQLLAEPPQDSGDQLLNEVVAALARVAAALAHAHGLGVVNRTIAPRTVQMARFGRVLAASLGVQAMLVAGGGIAGLTLAAFLAAFARSPPSCGGATATPRARGPTCTA